MTDCPPRDRLRELLIAAAPPAGIETLESHLRSCSTCRNTLDVLSDDAGLIGWRDGSPDAPAPTSRPNFRSLPTLGPPRKPGDLGSLGTYRIEAVVGKGGMGVVYRGWDEALNRPVAVKVLRPELDDPYARSRFVREARAAAGLHNDHVVAVYGVYGRNDGVPYFTMELLSAPSLGERVSNGPLAPREAADAVAQAADGVAAAHAAGLVHRDIKPANILTDPASGRVKVADFGLARDAVSRSDLSQDGSVVGTPYYLSPEQAAGRPVDGRSDVYSLGATLYEALTGTPPFRGKPLAVLRQVQQDEPPPLPRLNPDVPTDLTLICAKAMAKDPSRRYATAAGLRDDLRRWLDGRPIVARPVGRIERGRLWARRNPWAVAVILVSVVGFVASSAGWWRAGVKADESAGNAELAQSREREALQAKEVATAKAKLAEDRAVLALGTINTMVSKAQQLASMPGTLAVRQQLAEAALADLGKLASAGDQVPGADRTHLAAHLRLGDTLNTLGRSADAVRAWEKAAETAETLRAERPNDPARCRELSAVLVRLAYVDRRLGRHELAAERLHRAVTVLESASPASDPELTRELAVALNARADLSLDRGHYRAAITDYGHALEHVRTLTAADPKRVLYWNDLRYTEARLGATHFLVFDVTSAERHYRQAEQAAQKAVDLDPTNGAVLRDRNISLLDRSDAAARSGDYAESERSAREAIARLDPVAATEPDNGIAQRDLAIGYSLLGIALSGQNRPDEATQSLEKSLTLREQILDRSPGSALVAADIPTVAGLVIVACERQGRFDKAADWCDHTVAVLRRLRPGPPDPVTAGVIAALEKHRAAYVRISQFGTDPKLFEGQPAGVTERLVCLRALALVQSGKESEGLAAISEAKKTYPESLDVLTYHAGLHASCGGRERDATRKPSLLHTAVGSLEALAGKNPDWFVSIHQFPEFVPVRALPGYRQIIDRLAKSRP